MATVTDTRNLAVDIQDLKIENGDGEALRKKIKDTNRSRKWYGERTCTPL